MDESDQLGQISQCVGLEHALRACCRGDGTASIVLVDRCRHGFYVGVFAEVDFKLRDRPYIVFAASPLQKVQVRINQIIFRRRARLENSAH